MGQKGGDEINIYKRVSGTIVCFNVVVMVMVGMMVAVGMWWW